MDSSQKKVGSKKIYKKKIEKIENKRGKSQLKMKIMVLDRKK